MELCLKAVVHQLIEQAAQRFPRGRALFDLTGNGLEVGLEHLHAAEGQIIREMVDPVKQVQDVRVRLTGLFHICFQFLGRTGGEERIHCRDQVHQVVQARAVPHNGTVALELRVKHFFGLNHADVLEVAGYNEQQRRRIAHSAGQVDEEYLTAAVEQGELLLDLTRKDTVAQGIVYYQSVQQYRNQINHATDSAVKFQKDTGLLPLSTSAIEQTLGDVALYLFKLKECKAIAPVGIELLDSNKAF